LAAISLESTSENSVMTTLRCKAQTGWDGGWIRSRSRRLQQQQSGIETAFCPSDFRFSNSWRRIRLTARAILDECAQ